MQNSISLGGIQGGLNSAIGKNGIKLPKLEGVDYKSLDQIVENGYLALFVTPQIKKKIFS